MALFYHCRHCGTKIGKLDDISLHSEKLGFHKLTDQERMELISYDSSGDIHVTSICEDCQESLERNPAFYENDYLIH